jgi:hypothetical protein
MDKLNTQNGAIFECLWRQNREDGEISRRARDWRVIFTNIDFLISVVLLACYFNDVD